MSPKSAKTPASPNSTATPADFVLKGEITERFSALAKQRNVSVESLATAAVEQLLDRMESPQLPLAHPFVRALLAVNDEAAAIDAQLSWIGHGARANLSIAEKTNTVAAGEVDEGDLESLLYMAIELNSKLAKLVERSEANGREMHNLLSQFVQGYREAGPHPSARSTEGKHAA